MHWNQDELAIVNRAASLAAAQAQLPHRTAIAVEARWRALHGTARKPRTRKRPPADGMAFKPATRRNPLSPEQRRVAEILSAIRRITRREQLAVDVEQLLLALSDGFWRDIRDIEWSAQWVIGRDVQ